MSQRSSLTDGAATMGRQRGRDAAAWVFSGTTSAGSQDDALMLIGAGCEPFPSGGCADGHAGADLAAYAGIRPCGEDPGDAGAAYQQAASEAFWDELERLCHAYLADAR
jgi:hypothetical protein